jgi:hypothetical protein
VDNGNFANGLLIKANNSEFINNKIHDGSFGPGDTSCGQVECWAYPFYLNGGNDNLIERNEFYDFPSFGIHMNAEPWPERTVIRGNSFHHFGQSGRTTSKSSRGAAILVWRGYDTVIVHNTFSQGHSAVALHSGGAPRTIIYNNTIDSMAGDNQGIGCLYLSTDGTAVAKNNICNRITASQKGIINFAGNTVDHNLSDIASQGISIVGNPAFVDADNGDLTLTAGSAAIDAGTNSIAPCPAPLNCTLSAVHNGPLRDIGAFESIPFASANASTTEIIDITFGAAYAPLSTLSSCTGVTVRQNGVTKTCSTFANNGNATYRWTGTAGSLSAGGGTIDIAIAASKFTDSINIGGSQNQANFALPVTVVTNNISGGATEVFTSRHFRQRTFARAVTDTVAPAWIKAEDAVGTVRVDSGKFSNFWSIDCTVANCPSVGFQFEFSLNGAGYANVTDSCVTNAVCFDSTNSAAPHGTVIPTSQLTDALGNYLAGAVAAQASSYPVLDLAINQSTQIQGNFAIKSGLSVGDRICIRPKLDSGAAMTHAVTACFDVVNPAGSPA